MKTRTLAALLVAIAGAGCAGSIPPPTPGDLSIAQERWPDATAESLAQGRSLYVARCSGCHTLHRPAEYTPEQWTSFLDKMTGRARLTGPEKEAIGRYLQVAGRGPAG